VLNADAVHGIKGYAAVNLDVWFVAMAVIHQHAFATKKKLPLLAIDFAKTASNQRQSSKTIPRSAP